MFKHFFVLFLFSAIVVVATSHVQAALNGLIAGHDWVADVLKQVFSAGRVGDLTRRFIALLFIPLAVGFLPSFLYWLVKRSWPVSFMGIVWILWLIQTSALVVGHS